MCAPENSRLGVIPNAAQACLITVFEPVRVEGELKVAFQRIATSRGTTVSALIRAFMADTVAEQSRRTRGPHDRRRAPAEPQAQEQAQAPLIGLEAFEGAFLVAHLIVAIRQRQHEARRPAARVARRIEPITGQPPALPVGRQRAQLAAEQPQQAHDRGGRLVVALPAVQRLGRHAEHGAGLGVVDQTRVQAQPPKVEGDLLAAAGPSAAGPQNQPFTGAKLRPGRSAYFA